MLRSQGQALPHAWSHLIHFIVSVTRWSHSEGPALSKMIRSNSSLFEWPRLASARDAIEVTRSQPGWQAVLPWQEDQFGNFWIREQINHKLVSSLEWGGISSTRQTDWAGQRDRLPALFLFQHSNSTAACSGSYTAHNTHTREYSGTKSL